MKFTATLSLLPFVLGTGEERIRFGRSMHKRSRKLTAIPNGDGGLDAPMASNVNAMDHLPSAPTGFYAAQTFDTVLAIERPHKIFVQEEQRQLKTPMFPDRLLQTSNDFPEDFMSLAIVDMSYNKMAMSVEFFSMAPSETETTITPSTDASTGTSPTDVSTGTPPADNSTAAPTTEVTTETPPTDVSTTTTMPTEPISEHHFGNMIFGYLSQCAGLNLDTESCLVDSTIDEFMRVYATEAGGVNGQRLLRALGRNSTSEIDDEACGRPDVPEQDMRSIMSIAKMQCEDSGMMVSNAEFDSVLSTFLQLFASKGCWVSLCSGSDDSTELLFKILLDDAAECAGVQLDANECVMDHIVGLLVNGGDSVAASVSRSFSRMLQQVESNPCNKPSEEELDFFVSYLLTDAEAKCSGMGVDLNSTDWYELSSNLVTIFSSPTCWGVNGCNDESDVSTNSTAVDVPEEEQTIDIQLSADPAGQTEKNYTAAVIGAVGGAVALALFIVGLRTRNKDRQGMDDVLLPDDKSNDDESNDGQSTAYNTADLTYTTSNNDRINVSPLPSPASYCGPVPPILPSMEQDDGSLDLSEEALFISSSNGSRDNGDSAV